MSLYKVVVDDSCPTLFRYKLYPYKNQILSEKILQIADLFEHGANFG